MGGSNIKYAESDLSERLQALKDSVLSYGIECNRVAGFRLLNDKCKITFLQFLINYLNAQWAEERELIIPVAVKLITNDYEVRKNYLRFDFKYKGEANWLHVINEKVWY